MVCVFAHSIRGVECAREVRAAWRALFLPNSEGASDDARLPDLLAPSSMHAFFSLLLSSRSARVSACTKQRKREELDRVVVKLLIQETCGDTVAQRVQCGKVRMKFGLRTKNVSSGVSRENNVCNGALHVIGLYGLVDKVSLSSWRLGSLTRVT